jgi:hypothetical protein
MEEYFRFILFCMGGLGPARGERGWRLAGACGAARGKAGR